MKKQNRSWKHSLKDNLRHIRPPRMYWTANDGKCYLLIGKKRLKKRILERALNEVVRGVSFCHKEGLTVTSATLAKDFDIASESKCVLAAATGTGSYKTASSGLLVSDIAAGDMGFRHSYSLDQLHSDSWQSLMNRLWRAAGRFLAKHPEFGVV